MTAVVFVEQAYNITGIGVVLVGVVKSGVLRTGMKLRVNGNIITLASINMNNKTVGEEAFWRVIV